MRVPPVRWGTGARSRRPIVLGVHGASDTPEAACAAWSDAVAAWAFVVCPRGVIWHGHLVWGAPSMLAERADRALAAVRARYGQHVDDGPVVYGGFSQGATLAPRVVALRPGLYTTAILVEAGHTEFDAGAAVDHLRAGGVARVVVSCSSRPCVALAERIQRRAAGSAIAITLNDGGIGRGHYFDALMSRTLGRTMARVLEDDPRWSGLSAALTPSPRARPGP